MLTSCRGAVLVISIPVALLLMSIGGSQMAPLAQERQEPSPGNRRPVEVWLSIEPEQRQEMIEKSEARARAQLDQMKLKREAIDTIKNGPCLCGAPSHKACQTPDVCEPIEDKMMAGLAAEADLAYTVFSEVNAVKKELVQSADALKVIKRLRAAAMHKEIADLQMIRSKLENELQKVESRTSEEVALRFGNLSYLDMAENLLEQVIDQLPDDYKATAKEVEAAVRAVIAAWGSDDEGKKLEALGAVLKAARGSLRLLPGLDGKAKAALEVTNRLIDLGFETVLTHQQWEREHNVANLRSRLVKLVDKAILVGQAIPAAETLSTTFKTSWEVGSAGMLLVHRLEEAKSVAAAYEKHQEAQAFLRGKIEDVSARIRFKQRRLDYYEHPAKTN